MSDFFIRLWVSSPPKLVYHLRYTLIKVRPRPGEIIFIVVLLALFVFSNFMLFINMYFFELFIVILFFEL